MMNATSGWLICVSMSLALTSFCAVGLGDERSDKNSLAEAQRKVNALYLQGRYAEAATAGENLVALATKVHGENDVETAFFLNNLGMYYKRAGQCDKAEETYLRALQIRETKLGKDHPHVAVTLLNLGATYIATSQFAKAEPLLKRALEIWEAKLGKDDPQVSLCLHTLGGLYISTRQYTKAEPVLQRELTLREARSGKDDPQVITCLNTLGGVYYSMRQYAKAEPVYQRVLAAQEEKLGKNHPEVATCLANLAAAYGGINQHAKAVPMYLRALEINEAALGKNHPAVASILINMASIYQSMHQDAKAEPLLLRALQIGETAYGKDDPAICNSLLRIGGFYVSTDQFDKAEASLQRCMTIAEAKLPKDDLTLAECFQDLAQVYLTMASHSKAESMFVRALAIQEARLGKDSLPVADTLLALADEYRVSCQYLKAEPLCLRALEIMETICGKNDLNTARALESLGALYVWMDQLDKAEPFLRRAQEILEANLGKDDLRVGYNLSSQAEVCKQKGNLAKAAELYRRSQEIIERFEGKDSLSAALSLNGLGELYVSAGQLEEAEKAFVRSLEIREAKLGKDHPSVAYELDNLADLYRRRGEYARAEPLYQRSLTILELKLGREHFYMTNTLTGLAKVKAATGNVAQSMALCTRLIDSKRAYITHIVPSLPEAEQIDFLQHFQDALYISFSLGAIAKGEKTFAPLSAEWAINGKGILLDVLSERARRTRENRSPEIQAKANELESTRSKLAKLTMNALGAGDQDAYRKQMGDLQAREKELSKALGQASTQAGKDDTWTDLATVRAALPEDTVLIELARFPVFDFKATGTQKAWQSTHYAAWIIPSTKRGEVTFLDLGDAARINKAVGSLYTLFSSPIPIKDESTAQLAGEAVTKLWMPIQRAVGNARNLVISPDGLLWLLPWEALPDENGKFLVETRRISYTVSGRSVVGENHAAASHGAVVFADPDYDLDPAEALAETGRVLGGLPSVATTAPAFTGLSQRLATAGCKRVPDGADAAKAIAPKLKDYVHADPVVYLGKQALEGVFKSLKSPEVLVLITHGFSLEDQELLAAIQPDRRLGSFRTESSTNLAVRAMFENPLLRCGLALASVNNRQRTASGDDGLLMGIEIVGADLRGTELVVLGACDTGVGRLQHGEGVASLRQAFQLAGARSVVSTLWSVPTKETCQLLPMFFDNLAHGQGKAEALRNAQISMIAKLRKEQGDAAPWRWAAFTLTGDWR
jgi:tetratricopeptide (TPR) repeat protein